jgi:glutathione synthase/RimK-type ligase-like ATP-grasp enzyme
VRRPQLALITCASLPDLDPDDQLLLAPLRNAGVDVAATVWDDVFVDWNDFDLCVIRSTWDYPARRATFIDWARGVAALANPAEVIAWNTDKRYLGELATAGIPVVPTTWISPSDEVVLPPTGRYVLKPSVGAGSVDAAAFTLDDEQERVLAHAHVARLVAAGQTVMAQPYLDAIEQHGETALIFLGGDFSHAIVKGAMLVGDKGLEAGGLYLEESVAASEPTPAQLAVARRAIAAVPGGADQLTYARVDLVPDATGDPTLMELELTEPSLYLRCAPGAAERFAAVLAAQIERPGARPSAANPAPSSRRSVS